MCDRTAVIAAALAVPALFLVGTGRAAAAEPAEPEWLRYIGILGSFGAPDHARSPDIKDSSGIQLLYGGQSPEGWGLEIHGFARVYETGDRSGTDFYHSGAGVNLTYAFGDRTYDTVTPFVLVGAGYAYDDVAGANSDEADWFADAAIGFVTRPMLWEFFRVRGEIRGVYDNYGDSQSGDAYIDYQAALGVEFLLSEVKPREVESVRVVQVPTGFNDEDGDGIVDEKDECPNTEPGTRVDGKGCPLPKVLRLHGVTFEFDRERLRPDARTILGDIVEIMHRYPDMLVEIAGHTDSLGSDEYNQALSERRANAVRTHLVEQGVSEKRVTAVGYGESEPVASNDTDEGREVNRRVEMRIKN